MLHLRQHAGSFLAAGSRQSVTYAHKFLCCMYSVLNANPKHPPVAACLDVQNAQLLEQVACLPSSCTRTVRVLLCALLILCGSNLLLFCCHSPVGVVMPAIVGGRSGLLLLCAVLQCVKCSLCISICTGHEQGCIVKLLHKNAYLLWLQLHHHHARCWQQSRILLHLNGVHSKP